MKGGKILGSYPRSFSEADPTNVSYLCCFTAVSVTFLNELWLMTFTPLFTFVFRLAEDDSFQRILGMHFGSALLSGLVSWNNPTLTPHYLSPFSPPIWPSFFRDYGTSRH